MGTNYFNSLPLRVQLEELSKCRFMQAEEFAEGVDYIRGKKIVIVGCGANQLGPKPSRPDLDVSYALRPEASPRSANPSGAPWRTAFAWALTMSRFPMPTS